MSRSADVLNRAGLLPGGLADQVRRWGTPVAEPGELEAQPGPEHVAEALEEALVESRADRVTDPDLWRRYVSTARKAVLVLVAGGRASAAEVVAGRHLDGSWLLPWEGESPEDVLTNGETHLASEGRRYYFGEVREFHYGGRKAFVRCFVSTEEQDHG